MKIGILTVPFNNNYGGYLQCYALMSTLRKLGHDPVVINRRQNLNLSWKNRVKAFIANKMGNKCRMYDRKTMEAYYAMKGINMYSFVNQYLKPMTQPLYNNTDYVILDSFNFEAVVVGSDQVWRPKYVPDIEEYFLKYIPKNVRKLAYAASFGSDKIEYTKSELEICSTLLKSFYAVSTREKTGEIIVKDYLGRKDVQVVLDPTLLLAPKEYRKMMDDDNNFKDKHVFAYILDRTRWKDEIVSQMTTKHFCPVFDIMKIKKSSPFFSVEDWLKGLSTSEFVVTDSFHGTVFCILFNRPFYVIGNEKRGNSRIADLLSKFGLERRLLNEDSIESDKIEWNENINWKNVNKNLEILRKESINFLKHNLV